MFGRNSVSDANLSDSAWFGLLAKLAVDQGRYSAASKLAALANEANKLDPRQTTEANRAAARDALFGNQVVAVPRRGTTRDEHPTRPARVADVHPLQPSSGELVPISPDELARLRAEFDASRARADHPRQWLGAVPADVPPADRAQWAADTAADAAEFGHHPPADVDAQPFDWHAAAEDYARKAGLPHPGFLSEPGPVLRPLAEARMDDTAHTAVFALPPDGSRAPQHCGVVSESNGQQRPCGALIGYDSQLQGWYHHDPEITDHAASAARVDQG